MTAPVPYESRVRPLIAAASRAPWMSDAPNCLITDASREIVVDDVSLDHNNAALVVTTVNTAAASADLAEAVRAYRDATDMRETFAAEGNRSEYAVACVNETNAYRAMFAALARLDSAASSGGGA